MHVVYMSWVFGSYDKLLANPLLGYCANFVAVLLLLITCIPFNRLSGITAQGLIYLLVMLIMINPLLMSKFPKQPRLAVCHVSYISTAFSSREKWGKNGAMLLACFIILRVCCFGLKLIHEKKWKCSTSGTSNSFITYCNNTGEEMSL